MEDSFSKVKGLDQGSGLKDSEKETDAQSTSSRPASRPIKRPDEVHDESEESYTNVDLSNCRCQKNPNHTEFIKAEEFKSFHLNDLNTGNCQPYIFNYVKSHIPLSCKVITYYCSKSRPKKAFKAWPWGKNCRIPASGWVKEVQYMKGKYDCTTCGHEWRLDRSEDMTSYTCPGCLREGISIGERCSRCPNIVFDDSKGTCKCPKYKCEGFGVLCQCDDCVSKKIHADEYFRIVITTANHQIYNDEEAKESSITFFDYGKLHGVDGDFCENRKEVRYGRKKKDGYLNRSDYKKDYSVVYFYTHDSELVNTLQDLISLRWEARAELDSMLKEDQSQTDSKDDPTAEAQNELKKNARIDSRKPKIPMEEGKVLVRKENVDVLAYILIGYPHGSTCHVTVGKSVKVYNEDTFQTYNTSSCPGNSGGIGILINRGDSAGELIKTYPHSMSLGESDQFGKIAQSAGYGQFC